MADDIKVGPYKTVEIQPDVPGLDERVMQAPGVGDEAIYVDHQQRALGFWHDGKLYFARAPKSGYTPENVTVWSPDTKAYADGSIPASALGKYRAFLDQLRNDKVDGFATDRVESAPTTTPSATPAPTPSPSSPGELRAQVEALTAQVAAQKTQLEQFQNELNTLRQTDGTQDAAIAAERQRNDLTDAAMKAEKDRADEKARHPSRWGILLQILEFILRMVFPIYNLISLGIRCARIAYTWVKYGSHSIKWKEELARMAGDLLGSLPALGIVKGGMVGGQAVSGAARTLSTIGAMSNAGINLFWKRPDGGGGYNQMLGGINEWNALVHNDIRKRNPIRQAWRDVKGIFHKDGTPATTPAPTEATAATPAAPQDAADTTPVVNNGTVVKVGN
jgi:hypothetical protein